jgi:hypothetical protein
MPTCTTGCYVSFTVCMNELWLPDDVGDIEALRLSLLEQARSLHATRVRPGSSPAEEDVQVERDQASPLTSTRGLLRFRREQREGREPEQVANGLTADLIPAGGKATRRQPARDRSQCAVRGAGDQPLLVLVEGRRGRGQEVAVQGGEQWFARLSEGATRGDARTVKDSLRPGSAQARRR